MPRRCAALVLVLAALALIRSGAAFAEDLTLGDGGWSWFGDPRAVTYAGEHTRTFVGWVGRGGDITVSSYDHGTHASAQSVLHPALQKDDHASPSIQVRPDGRLAVFYSKHNGATLFYRVSVDPEDVSAWGPEQSVPTNAPVEAGAASRGYTYPNPVRLTGEAATYLFWRGASYQATFSVQRDGENTWSTAQNLVNVPGERPYVKYDSSGGDTIHFAFTNAHPREAPDVNIYYARYRAGAIERADGTRIGTLGTAITPADADKVFDGPEQAWVHDVAADSAGRPVIVFASFPSPTDHRYHYARWTGSGWDVHQITPAGGSISADGKEPQYSGGITLDHEDPSRVYLSRQVGDAWQIEVWTTSDGGTNWVSQAVTNDSSAKNVRPVSPRGLLPFNSGLTVIWLRGAYDSYVTYETSIGALLEEPPVEHPPSPASASGAPPGPRSATATAPRGARLSRAVVRVDRRGRGLIKVRCLAPPGDRCRVSGTLRLGKRRLGTLAGTVSGSRLGTVRLRLTRAGSLRLRRSGGLALRAAVVWRTRSGSAISRLRLRVRSSTAR
jgi:hypothetical protein